MIIFRTSFFAFIFYFLLIHSSSHASYSMTELEATALDVPDVLNTVVWDNTDTRYPNDDDKQTVAIGFPFQFDTVQYNNVTILTNGILKFGAIERMHRDYQNEALDSNEGDRFVAIYWDDLVDDASSSVTYGNSGSAPDRKFIVNWTNVKAYSNNLRYDFQVVLYENGDIRYRYNNNTANGSSATIGLEINDSDFIQYSFNQISVAVSFDLLFRNLPLTLPAPVAQYRFDEISWDGSLDEVVDSTLNNLHGRSFSGANTDNTFPALGTTIGTCNYGTFNGTSHYVEITDNNRLDFSNNFSIGAWIKIDSIPSSGLKTILSKDENYQLYVNSLGQINWRWQTSILNLERQFNSTATITAGSWHHIVISYRTGQQIIFIDGNESGSVNYLENIANNSDPLQIAADQNNSSRYFNGDIDEVNIFDQSLTAIQARELMDITRPCSSINLCVSSFPDGLNSHGNGTITFGRDAQLFFSPDDILDANAIVLNGASNDRSCVSAECQSNGLTSDITVSPVFPTTSGFTDDIIIGNNSSGSSDASINQYNQIDIGSDSVFTFAGSFDDYYIDVLTLGANTELEVAPGNYWIRNLDTGATSNPNTDIEIRVIGPGTARFYVNGDVTLGESFLANSPSQGVQGVVSQFMLFGYNNIVIERDATLSGIIYAVGNVDVQRNGNVYGAIAGIDISLGRLTNVYYDRSATAELDFGDLCQDASCTLGSFNITQPSYALACPGNRSQINIQAMCDDGISVKDDYIGTVDLSSTESSLSEFYASTVSASMINSVVFDGSESGLKDIYLFHQNENPNLQVIATDSSIPVSTTSSNETDYRTQGFSVNNPNSFVCGASSNMTLTAIGEDDTGSSCQVLTGFNGSKAFKAWYQVTIDSAEGVKLVSTPLSIASQLINDQTEPVANNIDLTFTNGIANFSLAYGNAGQVTSVSFKHDEPPYDGTVPELSGGNLSATTSGFVVRPDKIHLAVTTANSDCASADASCSKLVAAGSPFISSLQAQCMGGAVANDYLGSVALTHSLVSPLPGESGALGVSSATIAVGDEGSVQVNNQSISEVGIFNLSASDGNYFGQLIPTFTLANVGRFYPNHFIMTANTASDRCGSFSYMGQPGVTIDYSLQAQSEGGGLTVNYKSDFAKATMSIVAENNNDGGSYQDRFVNTSPVVNWVDGEYDFTFSGYFTRGASPDGPFEMLQVGTILSDNDGGISALNLLDMNADESTNCSAVGDCDAKLIGDLDMRYGQLKLSNVFGPEAFNLDMTVNTEYFDGTTFILNTDDNSATCTSLQVNDPPFSAVAGSWTDNLADGDSTISLLSNITAGVGVIRLGAAGLGNEGSVIYQYDTDSWLKTENTGDASYDDNPLGKITFGQYRGNDRMIYWREVVR